MLSTPRVSLPQCSSPAAQKSRSRSRRSLALMSQCRCSLICVGAQSSFSVVPRLFPAAQTHKRTFQHTALAPKTSTACTILNDKTCTTTVSSVRRNLLMLHRRPSGVMCARMRACNASREPQERARLGEQPGLDERAARQHGGGQLRAGRHALVVLGEGQDVAVADQLQPRRCRGARAYVGPVRLL